MLGLSGMFKYAIYFPFDFSTFQLGSPLALPWGLYVLICQLQKISELGNFECYFFFGQTKKMFLKEYIGFERRKPEKPCLNDVTKIGTMWP